MKPQTLVRIASVSLLSLLVLCVAWELWLAPLRPGGSWLVLKAVPLLFAVFGVLHGRRYTYQWMSMMILLYFTEGVLRLWDGGLVRVLAAIELVLALILFIVALMYSRQTAPSRMREGG